METTIFGPPGAGKTTKLLELVDEALNNGVSPQRIGFFSFSKAAAEEAKQRAIEKFGFEKNALPWFRTLHSLAFHSLGLRQGQIMGHNDYKKFEDFVGVPFSSYSNNIQNITGVLWRPKRWREGDQYLNVIMKARCMLKPAFDVYNELPPKEAWKINRQQLDVIENAFPKFRKLHGKHDFVALCEQFVEQGYSPEFDLLIIDEAQDLVPLQWEMLKKVMVPRAKRVYYAGDDDQAIYEWMGVDVNQFLNASEDKIILNKSHRITKDALELAKTVSNRITNRQEKEFTFKHENGEVRYHRWMKQIDLEKGKEAGEDWLILCRTNKQVMELGQELRHEGYYFYTEGHGFSTNPDILIAASIWLKLIKPKAEITWQELHDLCLRMNPSLHPGKERHLLLKRVTATDRDKTFSFGDFVRKTQLQGKITPETKWNEIIEISEKEWIYLERVRRSGERVLGRKVKPRIRLSTIHKAKGKEADNVILFTSTSKTIEEEQRRNPENEDRVFYVGLTRARRDLHIVEEFRKGKAGYRL